MSFQDCTFCLKHNLAWRSLVPSHPRPSGRAWVARHETKPGVRIRVIIIDGQLISRAIRDVIYGEILVFIAAEDSSEGLVKAATRKKVYKCLEVC